MILRKAKNLAWGDLVKLDDIPWSITNIVKTSTDWLMVTVTLTQIPTRPKTRHRVIRLSPDDLIEILYSR